MKILLYEWSSFFQHDLHLIFKEKGIEYDTFSWKFKDKNMDDEFVSWIEKNIKLTDYSAVFSVNYYPLLSEVCLKNGVKYVSWCYDNPLNVENIENTLSNENNYVFLYDRMQYEKYLNKGFKTVFHQILGVNVSRYSSLSVTEEDHKRFDADVAFIGKLYESHYYEIINLLDEYSKGYLQALMNAQSQLYGAFILNDSITDAFIEQLNSQFISKNPNTQFRLSKEALLFAMGSEITRKDRMILLSLAGNRYKTRFYSGDDNSLLNNVEKCGTLDYISEMPKMFACSKINLNPSLRLIETGIPQRAFDVMASGGLLLSNYQEELAEHYSEGDELVMYTSYEDAVDKMNYFLSHDDIRSNIAQKGKMKTLQEHSMQSCLENIWKVAKIDLGRK